MREIPEELRHGPFTLKRALALGVSREVVNGPRFRTPMARRSRLREWPDDLAQRCRAASLMLPGSAVFSHDTAVALGDWLAPHKPDLSWPKWRVAADYDGRHHAERDDEGGV